MKKIFFLMFTVFFLQSCFGFGDNDQSSTGLIQTETEQFSLLVPENWENVSSSDISNPSQGSVVFARKSQEEKAAYFNNIVIIQDVNKLKESSLSLMNTTKNTLELSMQKINILSEENIEFSDADIGKIIVFQGQYGTQTPSAHYIQSAKNCGEESYFITISVGSEIGDFTRYFPIIQSFTCKKL